MRNPWTELPDKPPFVLATDQAALHAFNARVGFLHRYDLSLLPEPFFGSIHAPVVVLNLNPGWHPDDAAVHAEPGFVKRCRENLEHTLGHHAFLHLHPESRTPGANWWRQRTRELVVDAGLYRVAARLACIQFFPYHSPQFARNTPKVPSQEYSFHLVRQAMARNAEIIVMRSQKMWREAIPELSSYARLHLGSNPRTPYLSRGNLKTSYSRILQRICE